MKVTINGISHDPFVPTGIADPVLPDAPASTYILLSCHNILNTNQKTELADLGVSILEYVADDTYLCHFEGTTLVALRNLPYVRDVASYTREFKIAPSLKPRRETFEIQNLLSRSFLGRAESPKFSEDYAPRTVDVVFHVNIDPESVRDKLALAARIDSDDLVLGRHKARLTVRRQYLSELEKIDEVRHIEEVLRPTLLNNVARGLIGFALPPNETDFQGQGEIVVVADTGFDIGDLNNVHPGFTDRVAQLYQLGRPGKPPSDASGHGTHVAGSAVGDWMSQDGSLRIRGAAPQARLIVQALFGANGDLTGLPTDLNDLFQVPYQNDGARIHNNSWGYSPGQGQYNQPAWEVDEFVWNHRDCVICFGAGNEGSDNLGTGRVGPQSITSPGTAKNCITVGATENNRPDIGETYGDRFSADFPKPPISSDSMTNNPDGIAAFSSRGPTQNNRIKPDLVAPGTFILSAKSRMTGTFGWRNFDGLSFFDGGTSMATPLISGCAAVVRQFLRERHQINRPSAALVKALLINGARDVVGQFIPTESGIIPNYAEGYGRVDMRSIIGPIAAGAQLILIDEATALETGQDERRTIPIGPENSSLKVTLVWTDPPGDTLQNDLDLIVRTPGGEERHGNVNEGAADFDRSNNVEQVFWTAIPQGEVEIIVRAERITQFPQSYALVIRTI
jgi:subtilisin family serine protease